MTVCFGPFTCAGTWDMAPIYVGISGAALTLAVWYERKAFYAYAGAMFFALLFGTGMLNLIYPLYIGNVISKYFTYGLWDMGPWQPALFLYALLAITTAGIFWSPALNKRYGWYWLIPAWAGCLFFIILFLIRIVGRVITPQIIVPF